MASRRHLRVFCVLRELIPEKFEEFIQKLTSFPTRSGSTVWTTLWPGWRPDALSRFLRESEGGKTSTTYESGAARITATGADSGVRASVAMRRRGGRLSSNPWAEAAWILSGSRSATWGNVVARCARRTGWKRLPPFGRSATRRQNMCEGGERWFAAMNMGNGLLNQRGGAIFAE